MYLPLKHSCLYNNNNSNNNNNNNNNDKEDDDDDDDDDNDENLIIDHAGVLKKYHFNKSFSKVTRCFVKWCFDILTP